MCVCVCVSEHMYPLHGTGESIFSLVNVLFLNICY